MGAMPSPTQDEVIAFSGSRRIASGPLATVQDRIRKALDRSRGAVLVFDLETSAVVDLDFREPVPPVEADTEPEPPARSGPGRPRLGVVAREVTLLPRHWEWLADQPGGASVTLRKLVEQARHQSVESDRIRKARESAYRFIVAMAGDRAGFEEATRALFAGDHHRFERHSESWPADIKTHARALMGRTLS